MLCPGSRGEGCDGDGLTDAQEGYYDCDPANPDTDFDGVSDSAEVANGTDPTIP